MASFSFNPCIVFNLFAPTSLRIVIRHNMQNSHTAGMTTGHEKSAYGNPDLPPTNRRYTAPEFSDNHGKLKPAQLLFAGRIGGNQEFIIDRRDPDQAELLRKTPDAAPFMSLKESFDLRGFSDIDLWKGAFLEGIGKSLEMGFLSWRWTPNNISI